MHQFAWDVATGLPLAIESFPADEQEYDHLPALYDAVVDGRGEAPMIMSFDRHYAYPEVNEFLERRGVAPAAARRKFNGREFRENWRTDLWDEDGIPRCRYCGSECDQDSPGLGFEVDSATGEPLLHYRCLTPHRPECRSEQTIHCSESFVMLLPLSRKTELYNAVRDYHLSQEHSIEHQRRRNSLCGKDETGRLFRWGVAAQHSRAQFALVLDWLRLGIRHGWIEVGEGVLHDGRETEPIRRNRVFRLTYRSTTGLRARIEQRRAAALELPYGTVAMALGLAPPQGWLARGAPPPQ